MKAPTVCNDCPWCRTMCRDRMALRVHVATNRCGRIPVEMVVPFTVAEARATDEVKEWQPLVEQTARRFGWHDTHVRRARVGRNNDWITPTSRPGFPDLWLLRPPQMLVLELKRRGNKAHPKQVAYIAMLQQVPGVTAAIVEPMDWPAVYRALSGLASLTDVNEL